MFAKRLLLLSVIVIMTVSYIVVFTGTKELPTSKIIEKYDPYFKMLVIPHLSGASICLYLQNADTIGSSDGIGR